MVVVCFIGGKDDDDKLFVLAVESCIAMHLKLIAFIVRSSRCAF